MKLLLLPLRGGYKGHITKRINRKTKIMFSEERYPEEQNGGKIIVCPQVEKALSLVMPEQYKAAWAQARPEPVTLRSVLSVLEQVNFRIIWPSDKKRNVCDIGLPVFALVADKNGYNKIDEEFSHLRLFFLSLPAFLATAQHHGLLKRVGIEIDNTCSFDSLLKECLSSGAKFHFAANYQAINERFNESLYGIADNLPQHPAVGAQKSSQLASAVFLRKIVGKLRRPLR